MAEPRTPGPEQPSFRRRIIVIKRALQIKYVMLIFLSVALTTVIVALDVYYVFGRVFLRELGADALAPVFRSATVLLAVHLSVFAVAAGLLALFVSHKFAGPLFRLEKVVEAVASGDLTVKAVLRRGDDLFETADAVNRMIEALREKTMQDKNLSGRIARRLEEVSARLRSGELSVPAALPVLKELEAECRHIGTHFKL